MPSVVVEFHKTKDIQPFRSGNMISGDGKIVYFSTFGNDWAEQNDFTGEWKEIPPPEYWAYPPKL